MSSYANEKIYNLLIEKGVVVDYVLPSLPFIPDKHPLSLRIKTSLPVKISIAVKDCLFWPFNKLWGWITNKYPNNRFLAFTERIMGYIGQFALFVKDLVPGVKQPKETNKVKVTNTLIFPGQIFSETTEIVDYRFCSFLYGRYIDVHKLTPRKAGVLVEICPKSKLKAKNVLLRYIPLEIYELCLEAELVKESSLIGLALTLTQKLGEIKEPKESEKKHLLKLHQALSLHIGKEHEAQSIQLAIFHYKQEIQKIQEDTVLSEADRRLIKAQLLSQLNRLFSM